jgi:hypothetical protein
LAVRVARNYSINSLISRAMLDPLSEHPAPYYYSYRAWQNHEKQRSATRTHLAAAWRTGQLSWHRHPADDGMAVPHNANSLATGTGILQILDVLEHRNPAVWAANQRLDYLSVLRRCVARYSDVPKDRQAAKIVETCYYHLDLFHPWEAVEKSRGMLTSREIEKGLRWNGGTTNYRGLEFAVIRRSLATQGTAIAPAVLAVRPSRNAHEYRLPGDGEGVPLADRLARVLGVPNRSGGYLPVLSRVCDYLSHAIRPDVRWPIRTALRKAEPLVAEIVAAINHGAAPTLLRKKILGTITLSGYSIPEAGGGWEYGSLRERRGIAAFMAWHGVQLLRSGNRAAAAQWETASVMLSAQDDVALGIVAVLGRYLPATPTSPMYEPSALPHSIVRELREMCESRLTGDTRFFFNVYKLETLPREQLHRRGNVPALVRNAYLARLHAMIGEAARGSLSRQYFFLQRVITILRIWGSGSHFRMTDATIRAINRWAQALLSSGRAAGAERAAALRWVKEASLRGSTHRYTGWRNGGIREVIQP